ncbi:MAG: hypothetical protein AAF662_12140, partial [Pseudomonadota bacterium]
YLPGRCAMKGFVQRDASHAWASLNTKNAENGTESAVFTLVGIVAKVYGLQGLKPKNHVPMLSLENCPTRAASAASQPRLSLFLLLLALLVCAPQVSAGLIRELWEGTVADSELPGWNPGDLFRFTVSYDDSDSTFIQRGLGADGIAGTADDIEIPFNNTCFGGVVCYRPAADASFDFGDLRSDAAAYAVGLGDPLRTIAPDNFNYQARITLDPFFFGYTGNNISYIDNGLWFQAFYEGTGVRPNGIDNLISAVFTTQSNQNFAVNFGDVALSQIALGEEVATGRVSATVPIPQSLYLTAFGALVLVRRRGPRLSQ